MTKKEVSVEDKLRTLYALQLIDCKIDELRNVRGELPLEVEDLEDEVAGLESRAERLVNDIEKINVDIFESFMSGIYNISDCSSSFGSYYSDIYRQ